ncbi:GNAT family N-acetyltransferase [Arcobacter vandammei]|uniref:GNAT family N-acetyltransferase n=1 Tax=Arcobacter vandammei TaxID=2782243 RepID=UPI0018DF6C48|nr:GNAT family N-acetyltransferase [Arcobacter vandammei]
MILKQDNILLRRVEEKDIEMIRNWRNDPKISQYMSFRDYITQEMQKKWFEKINNDNNYFFIINIENTDIGMVDVKNIDYSQKIAEGGIFIYDDKYLSSIYPLFASYLVINFVFDTLKLEKFKAQIMEDNKRAIRYNKSLGFKPTDEIDGLLRTYYLVENDWTEAKNTIEILIKN